MATPIPSNRVRLSVRDLLSATGGRLTAGDGGTFVGLSTDTRAIVPGSVFLALRGERFDGHQFVEAACAAGACIAVVDHELPVAIQQLVVPDTLVALGDIASYHRKRWGGRLVAIAGAAGKTTTRATTSAMLEAVFGQSVHSTAGNLNNRIGVPMTLLGLTPEHEFGVVEVGTNQVGEVPVLASIVRPDVAVLTLVDLEHTEGLGDLDSIEKEEGAIFVDTCHTVVVNGDDARALRQARQAQVREQTKGRDVRLLSYGFGPEVGLSVVSRQSAGTSGARIEVAAEGRSFTLQVPLVGKPACYAVLAAIAAAEALVGRPFAEAEIQAGLASPSLRPEGRAELVPGPTGILIINDSYNANPASMRAAVVTAAELASQRNGRIHLVLGEMRELGAMSAGAHADLGRFLLGHTWQSLFAVGQQMIPLVDVVRRGSAGSALIEHSNDTVGIGAALRARLSPEDVVLVKGSRGVRTETVIADILSENNL